MVLFSVANRFIYAELAGGLGNQIFVFEMAQYLSSLNNSKIFLNKFNVSQKHSRGSSDIGHYQLPNNTKFTNYGNVFNKFFNPVKRYLKYINKLDQNFILVLDDTDINLNQNKIVDLIKKRNPRLIIVLGFWQDFSYWRDNLKYTLCDESESFTIFLRELLEQHPVIFHYRLSTQYEDWEQAWGILSPNFLNDALFALNVLKSSKAVNLWIFSNNVDMARYLLKNYVSGEHLKIRFIDDSELSPAEVIMLLSKSQFLICSNSTFSIAAAKIGNVPNVVVPTNLSKKSSGITLTSNKWIRVNSSWLQ